MAEQQIKFNYNPVWEDINKVFIGAPYALTEQAQAIYDYCITFHKDSKLLAAIGSLIENIGAG